MVKGAGRGKVGEESFFYNLAETVYSPKGCCVCSAMGSSLPLEASIKNTMQTNTHRTKAVPLLSPSPEKPVRGEAGIAKKGRPPKPNSRGGWIVVNLLFLSFFIAICN